MEQLERENQQLEGWGCQGRGCPSWEPCGWGTTETAGEHSLAENVWQVDTLLVMWEPWDLSQCCLPQRRDRLVNQACPAVKAVL